MADLDTLRTRLTEAETALHRLQTGSAVEEIAAPDGSRTRFMPTDAARLEAYIGSLTQQIERASRGFPRGPIYFTGGR
ncbi:MAG: gpW family protein [Acidobacteria bacterium]|nr:gpW family protein [Acidobacteriota bacterium]